jgi:hypothetical protein
MSSVTQNLPQGKPAPRATFRSWWKENEIAWWPLAIVAVAVIVIIAQHVMHLHQLVHH